jgi:hypothetical protein
MNQERLKEIYRAERILFIIEECNDILTDLYEQITDREFKDARKNSEDLIKEIKIIIKLIENDDF